MEGESGLNPKDFVSFKTEIDLLCDCDIDVYRRWDILEKIQKTKVLQNQKDRLRSPVDDRRFVKKQHTDV